MCFLLALSFTASVVNGLNPHDRVHPKTPLQPIVGGNRLKNDVPELSFNVTELTGTSAWIEVSWSDMSFTRTSDWIGIWPGSASTLSLFTAPLKFKHLTPYNSSVNPPPSGSVVFQVINMRTPLMAFYVGGNAQFPEIKAASPVIAWENTALPTGIHIALGDQPTQMNVYWTSDGTPSTPGVKFGLAKNQMTSFSTASVLRKPTPEDMCDPDLQPAAKRGWMDPGTLLSATLEGLIPDTEYVYSVGDDKYGWSTPRSFMSAPAPDPNRSTVIAAFGDMGNVEADGSFHHSWDFGDRGEIPSINTSRLVAADDSEIVVHIGDISYAVGYESEWDTFLSMIQPAAAHKPWMTSIGNHEQGWSGSFIPGTDSGGECGVQYNARFPYSSQNPSSTFKERKPWYKFSYGPVTFVMMSTEHNYTEGSEQHEWIASALASVNRTATPWLVFTGHRPAYVDSSWSGDSSMARQLRKAVEDLIVQYEVDLALWGHFHAYERSCSTLYDLKCGSKGVQHLVIGMAGYTHSPLPDKKASWVEFEDMSEWGYLKLEFQSSTHLTGTYIADSDGRAVDQWQMLRPCDRNGMRKCTE